MLIELRDIAKIYEVGSETVHALRDIDLAVAENEYLAIMGPSGSGKSTLMNIVGCLDTPSGGSYTLRGYVTEGGYDEALDSFDFPIAIGISGDVVSTFNQVMPLVVVLMLFGMMLPVMRGATQGLEEGY